MKRHIEKFDNFQNLNEKYDDKSKETVMKIIINRSNLMTNKHDKIDWSDENLLKIKIAYFDYGKGTKILPILKHKVFYFDYCVDFKNKKLMDKNFLGTTYDLTDDELEKISNKYYWVK